MNLERALANAPDPALARVPRGSACAKTPPAREILERPIVAPVAIQLLGLLARPPPTSS